MSIIVCENVALSYGVDVILENISCAVNEGARVGVIGANGAGKTTLFKLILKRLEPTSGAIYISKNATMGFLEQISDDNKFGDSVLNIALSAFSELLRTEKELATLEARLSLAGDSDIARYTALHDSFIRDGGLTFRERTRSMLARFGFDDVLCASEADLLSGGQKTKLMLIVLLLRDPDVILLDEPTNHLDIESVDWLESYIKASKKTFMIVSHDRYFLDRVTTDTLEIEHKVSRMYSGSYSVYREKKRKLDEDALKHYLQQQKDISKIEAYIEQQRRWGQERNFDNIRNRTKMLERMDKLEKPKAPPKSIHFSIADSTSRAFNVLSVRGLSKSYPGISLFSGLSFEVHYHDRLFIIGGNGCGKSTLLKILTGRETPDSGVFETGYNQRIGYYDQDQKLLNNDLSVLNELWEAYDDKLPSEIRKILAQFGFYGDDVFKQVSVLSGGERARLSIAKMILKGVSLLILDEPTNHLDIASKEILENTLSEYDGTIICVSHDRYFISSLATQVLEISADGYKEGYKLYHFGYNEYLLRCSKAAPDVKKRDASATRMEHEKDKREKNRRKIAITRHRQVESEITKKEAEIKEIDDLICGDAATDFVRLEKLYADKEDVEKELEALYEELFALDEELNG